MRRVAAVLVVLVAGGCEIVESPRPAPPDRTAAAAPAAPLVNRAWVAADDGASGALYVFLEDGTLLTTSCAEPYRLAEWAIGSDGTLSWDANGARLHATVVRQSADSLLLAVQRGDVREERRFAAADGFACPEPVR